MEKYKIKNRIERFCENKINAFSPTISPAPKSFGKREVESISGALDYYTKRGVTEFVVQKKYMGSYCDIYLMKEIENTYFVSRNGFRITQIDQEVAIAACKSIHDKIEWTGLSTAIIASEIMPWSAVGKKLIETEFAAYYYSHSNHAKYLEQSNLMQKVQSVKDDEAVQKYIADVEQLSEKEVKKKYPSHIVRQYEALLKLTFPDMTYYKEGIDLYKKQLDHYGREGDIVFKPFSILKYVHEDGSETLPNDNLSIQQINEDKIMHFYINDSYTMETAEADIKAWYESLTADMEEGIMIKPRTGFIDNLPPAFKVRNNDYLTLIYGVHFQRDYDYYLKKRNIEDKLQCSIFDWKMNKQLLSTKYNDIHNENFYFKNLVYDRIMGENKAMQLDPRL